MASDLISRSALIEKFNDETIQISLDLPIQEILGDDVDVEDFFMLAQEIVQQYRKMAINTIRNQPTAYDVDAVEQEIKNYFKEKISIQNPLEIVDCNADICEIIRS